MKLNEASLAVWYELLKNEEMKDIAHKILLNSALSSDDGKITKEMKELLKKEKSAILEAKDIIENNNNISKHIKDYIKELELEGNETLKGIFSNRALMEFMSGDLTSIEQVDSIYEQVRIEYLTVDTHTKIKEEYKNSIKLDLVDCIESKFNEGINDKKDDEVKLPEIKAISVHPTAHSNPIVTPEIKDLFSTLFGKSVSDDTDIKFKFISLDDLKGGDEIVENSTTYKLPSQHTSTPVPNFNLLSDNIKESKPSDPSFNDAVNQMIYAELEAIHKEVFETPITKDEFEIAHEEAIEEGWYEDDLKESVRTLLVYIARLEHQMGL